MPISSKNWREITIVRKFMEVNFKRFLFLLYIYLTPVDDRGHQVSSPSFISLVDGLENGNISNTNDQCFVER